MTVTSEVFWADGVRDKGGDDGHARARTDAAKRGNGPGVCSDKRVFVYHRGTVTENAELMVEIKHRVRLAINTFRKTSKELYGRPRAPLVINIRVLTAEILETVLYTRGVASQRRPLQQAAHPTPQLSTALCCIGFRRQKY